MRVVDWGGEGRGGERGNIRKVSPQEVAYRGGLKYAYIKFIWMIQTINCDLYVLKYMIFFFFFAPPF